MGTAQAQAQASAPALAEIRCGLVCDRRDRSASPAAPPRSYRAFQPYTDWLEAPYGAAISAAGDPLHLQHRVQPVPCKPPLVI